jgi:hypothetical protein
MMLLVENCDCTPVGYKPDERLMVQGEVCLCGNTEPVMVQRGMKLLSCDGIEVGLLGALIFDCQQGAITQFLLCQLPLSTDYRRVLVGEIAGIKHNTIQLTIRQDDIPTLPVHHTT